MVIEIFLITLCLVLLIAFLWERRKWMQTRRALQKEADELKKTSYIAGAVLSVGVIALIVIFQEDIRRLGIEKRTCFCIVDRFKLHCIEYKLLQAYRNQKRIG